MIRKFVAQDKEQVMQIWLETNLIAHDFIASSYWQDNYLSVGDALSTAEVFVFAENGEIKGFVGIVEGYIAGLFVKKELQKQGIGTALLAKCQERYSQLELKVYSKNLQAINFYRKNGFCSRETSFDDAVQQEETRMVWTA